MKWHVDVGLESLKSHDLDFNHMTWTLLNFSRLAGLISFEKSCTFSKDMYYLCLIITFSGSCFDVLVSD